MSLDGLVAKVAEVTEVFAHLRAEHPVPFAVMLAAFLIIPLVFTHWSPFEGWVKNAGGAHCV